jgi:hypothetical protein
LVAEVGMRAIHAVGLSVQDVVQIHVDGSHNYVGSDPGLLLTTLSLRLFGTIVPIAFIMHHNKSEALYAAAMQEIDKALHISELTKKKHVSFMCDDDAAVRAALKSPFPDTPVLQCVWHAFGKVREMYHARLKTLLSRCKNGALPVSDDTRGNRRNYDFLGELTLAALRRIRDDLPDVFSAARQFALDEMTG